MALPSRLVVVVSTEQEQHAAGDEFVFGQPAVVVAGGNHAADGVRARAGAPLCDLQPEIVRHLVGAVAGLAVFVAFTLGDAPMNRRRSSDQTLIRRNPRAGHPACRG